MKTRILLALVCTGIAGRAFAQTTTAISFQPASVPAGGTLTITDTVRNNTTAPTAAATQTFSLQTAGGWLTIGQRAIPALTPGAHLSATTTIALPATVHPGTYLVNAGVNPNDRHAANGQLTVTIAQVTVRGRVTGPGRMSGIVENHPLQTPNFPNCVCTSSPGVTSASLGSAFIITAIPVMVPATKSVPQHLSSLVGWTGANCVTTGTAPGPLSVRIVPVTPNQIIECRATFQ